MALAVVSAAAVGALVASRRPRHPVGWLLLGVGLAVAVNVLAEPYVKYGLLVRPGSLPAARYLVPLLYSTWLVGLACAGFVLLLTPTGSLPSPRWRWWARVAAAAPVLVVLGFAVQPDPMAPEYLGNPLAVPALAPGCWSPPWPRIVVIARPAGRGRVAGAALPPRPRGRAPAAALAGPGRGLRAGGAAGRPRRRRPGRGPVVLAAGLALCLALLPLATGAAILRYRLYDLDRIISRTLAYGLLTVLLGWGYAAVVLGLGQLLRPRAPAWSWPPPPWPWRRCSSRPAAASSRRSTGASTGAATTPPGRSQAFSARLRDQVDLDTLTAELLAVVDQTMQPTQASLWLRRPAPRSGRARTPPSGAGSPAEASLAEVEAAAPPPVPFQSPLAPGGGA